METIVIEHRFIDGKVYEAKGCTEKLHVDLQLAGLGARISVSADVVRSLGATGPEPWKTLRHWALALVLSGPDMRYSSGSLVLNESTWQPFVQSIREAVARLRALAVTPTAGTYTRSLSDAVAIETEAGVAYLRLALRSDTNVFTKRRQRVLARSPRDSEDRQSDSRAGVRQLRQIALLFSQDQVRHARADFPFGPRRLGMSSVPSGLRVLGRRSTAPQPL